MRYFMGIGLAILLSLNLAYASDRGAIIGGIAGGVICHEASKGDPAAILLCTAVGAAAGHELIDRPDRHHRRVPGRHHRDQPRRVPGRHHRDQPRRVPDRHHRPLPPPVYDGEWDWNRCDGIYYRGKCDQWQEEPYCYGRDCWRRCQSNYWSSGDRICFKQGGIVYFPPSDSPCRKMVCEQVSDSCRCVERRRRW